MMKLIAPHHVKQMQMISAYLGRVIPCYFTQQAGTDKAGRYMFNFCNQTAIITGIILRQFLRYYYKDGPFEVHAIESVFKSPSRGEFNHAYVWIENKSPAWYYYGFIVDYAKIDIQVGFKRSFKNDLTEYLKNPATQEKSVLVKEGQPYDLDEMLSGDTREYFTGKTTHSIVVEINALMEPLYRSLGLQPDILYPEVLDNAS